ncbi:GTP 3',8-cyclase MoaA [bacterium]|nr:GTP 3',8-cyclase MoaA [bacterium]
MQDRLGRTIDYVRISVTDRCNLRCRYCMPEEGVPMLQHEDILRFEEITAFMRVAVGQGIVKVRLTGGEPLNRPGIVNLVRMLLDIPGLKDLSLTTNGTLLPQFAPHLKAAGLKRINIGLPSLDPATYAYLTRLGSLDQALAGLKAAIDTGFSPVKLNVVVLRGVNDDLAPYLDLTRRLPVEVRFIEYMTIGPLGEDHYLVPAAELRRKLEALAALEPAEKPQGNGPAQQYFRIPGAPGTVAIIAPMTEHFCPTCNRLRLVADGHLRLCLFGADEIDIKPALRPTVDEEALRRLLEQAMQQKPECMPDTARDYGRAMGSIGG